MSTTGVVEHFDVLEDDSLAVGNDRQFERFCSVIGLSPAVEYARNVMRLRHRDALSAENSSATSQWLRFELLAALDKVGVPAGPINSVAEAFADLQVIHREMRLEMPEPDGSPIPGVRLPLRFCRSGLATPRPSSARPV
jgi:crotonobetainyl-CoA:carnitine CoA-transferase CaiB-like acyl-CoA transferase